MQQADHWEDLNTIVHKEKLVRITTFFCIAIGLSVGIFLYKLFSPLFEYWMTWGIDFTQEGTQLAFGLGALVIVAIIGPLILSRITHKYTSRAAVQVQGNEILLNSALENVPRKISFTQIRAMFIDYQTYQCIVCTTQEEYKAVIAAYKDLIPENANVLFWQDVTLYTKKKWDDVAQVLLRWHVMKKRSQKISTSALTLPIRNVRSFETFLDLREGFAKTAVFNPYSRNKEYCLYTADATQGSKTYPWSNDLHPGRIMNTGKSFWIYTLAIAATVLTIGLVTYMAYAPSLATFLSVYCAVYATVLLYLLFFFRESLFAIPLFGYTYALHGMPARILSILCIILLSAAFIYPIHFFITNV